MRKGNESANTLRTVRAMSIATASVLLASFGAAYAQEPANKQDWGGQIQDVEIEIVQKREITLPRANRNFEKIPPRPAEQIAPPIRYDFESFSFSAPQASAPVRPLKLKAFNDSKVYGGYLRAGYGNFGSPLLEGYLTTTKDRNKLLGAKVYHFSSAKGPVDGANSGSGNSSVSVFGRTFTEAVALSGSVEVENRATHFYGYPADVTVDRADIRQSYNHFRLGGDISNAKNAAFSYKLGAGFGYTADRYDARETEANVLFNTGYKIGDESRFTIDASYTALGRKDIDVPSDVRSLFSVTPAFIFSPLEGMRVRLGLTAAYENDTLESRDFHVYPALGASYPVSPSVDLYANLTGAMEKVSLQSLSQKNIWIAPNAAVNHTNKIFELDFGVNARIGNKVAFHTGLALANLENMHFFVNSETDVSKFDVVYEEGNLTRTNLFASLSYAQSEKAKFMLRGDVFAYGTDNLQEAWHMPRYKLNANASLSVLRKVNLGFDVIGQGGMKAFDPVTDQVVELDGALDVNARIEYLFSDSFSFFVRFNNITGVNYPLYLNYPVRGFQVLGGLTWTF